MAHPSYHFDIYESSVGSDFKNAYLHVSYNEYNGQYVFALRAGLGYSSSVTIYFDLNTANQILQRLPEAIKLINMLNKQTQYPLRDFNLAAAKARLTLTGDEMSHWNVHSFDLETVTSAPEDLKSIGKIRTLDTDPPSYVREDDWGRTIAGPSNNKELV